MMMMMRRRRRKKKDKTKRAMGVGRRTRDKTAKWNQMTALRFQTRGKMSDIPGLPSGSVRGLTG